MSIPPRSADIWTEPAKGGGTPSIAGEVLVYNGSAFELQDGADADAILVDYDNSGRYTFTDLRTPGIHVSGSDIDLATVGTPVAQFVSDGAGGFVFSTDMSLTPVAALYQQASGGFRFVAFNAPQQRFVRVNANTKTYLTNG